jgi:hypothetical protein
MPATPGKLSVKLFINSLSGAHLIGWGQKAGHRLRLHHFRGLMPYNEQLNTPKGAAVYLFHGRSHNVILWDVKDRLQTRSISRASAGRPSEGRGNE